MTLLARLLVIALLAVFAASSVAQASAATTMAARMALAADHGMGMEDCQACGSGDARKADAICDLACVPAPALTALGWDQAPAFVSTASHPAPAARDLAGWTGPPDPHPPRSLLPV